MEQNAVIGSLLDNLDFIEIIFKETNPPFQIDKGNTGDSKEYSVQSFLSSYLTHEYRIQKGNIFSTTSSSQNIDCVILAPNHPKLATPKRNIILAEGVYAAVEIKPNIKNKNEFARGLEQIKSVKALERKTYRLDYSKLLGTPKMQDFQKKIPCIIFSAVSLTPVETVTFIKNKIINGELTIYDLPDLILTLDNGLFVISPDIKTTRFGKWFLENMKGKGFKDDTILHFPDTTKAQTLALFLLHFLALPSAIENMHDFILNEYLKGLPPLNVMGYKMS